MVKKPVYTKDLEKVNNYGEILNQAMNHSEIKPRLEAFGYDEAVINEGIALHTAAKEAFDFNLQESLETRQSREAFESQWKALQDDYSNHRQIARAVFRKNALVKAQLKVSETVPSTYKSALELFTHFYNVIEADDTIKTALARLRLTEEKLSETMTKLEAVTGALNDYYREMAEDQPATARKNTALDKLTDWMDDFFEVAKIAMEDEPQLLEILKMRVK
jgi:DNA repair ATPase RecN